jgi:hypothetical protein
MKKIWLLLLLPFWGQAQRQQEWSIAFTNNHTAFPFSSFSRLFSGPVHPGFEVGYRFNWKTKPRHDWFQSIQAGYFNHRFLQHAIPLYTQAGYRYKIKEHLRFSGALGVGYLQSVPATAVLQLNEDGNYSNAKGIGRGQALINFSIGTQYRVRLQKRPVSIFIDYRQMIQTPFVKSYVPLLPYNSIAIGTTISLQKKSTP